MILLKMENNRLYYSQIIVVTTLLIYATGLLALPRSLTSTTGTSGWISIIIGALIGFLISNMIANIALHYPDMGFTHICETACGKKIGKIISFTFFIYTSFILSIGMRQFATTITIPFLNEMRIEVIVIVSFLLIMYAVNKGIGTIARFAFISFPVVFVSFILIVLFSKSAVDMGRVLPIMGKGILPIINSGIEAASFFGEIIILLAILKYFPKKKLIRKAINYGIIIAAFIMIVMVMACISIFGTSWVEHFSFPIVELAKLVGIGEFFERVEILFITLWFNTAVLKLSILYYVSVICLNDFLKFKNYRKMIFPYAVFSIWLTLLPENMVESFVMLDYFREYSILYVLAIVLILTICTRVKHIKNKNANILNCVIE